MRLQNTTRVTRSEPNTLHKTYESRKMRVPHCGYFSLLESNRIRFAEAEQPHIFGCSSVLTARQFAADGNPHPLPACTLTKERLLWPVWPRRFHSNDARVVVLQCSGLGGQFCINGNSARSASAAGLRNRKTAVAAVAAVGQPVKKLH